MSKSATTSTATAPSPLPDADDPRARILTAARSFLFAQGIAATTMDALASELGMSKKTLYLYFPGKDAIITAIIDGMAALMEERIHAMLSNSSLSCPERLCFMIETVGTAMGRISPTMMRDLQQRAPEAYLRIDEIRRRNIPRFFGRIIRDGIADGTIRGDIDPMFATEFWLQSMRGMLSPETMERTQLSPHQTLKQAVELFFRGLLTPAGREQFSDHLQRCAHHVSHKAPAEPSPKNKAH